ncbi:MAG: glycosyltransferase [Tannerellaceae bacterium]|jgi:glycosyltransferase involved in cell wall biosynthesis|nr:glycosyltransferase [Tannerellaceae bacterium]
MTIKPDYIFESSWEVCNKVGGIYTVLSTKAFTLQTDFTNNMIFIGPDFKESRPIDFLEDRTLLADWRTHAADTWRLKLRVGCWNVVGQPIVILVDFMPFMKESNDFFYEMWERFGVDSIRGYGDYRESCVFAYSAGKTIESFCRFFELDGKQIVSVFNEWTLGMGLLYIKKHLPEAATVFVTHATTTGRSMSGNGLRLYSLSEDCDADVIARQLNVDAKHSLEKQAAAHADCFTTVSDITALECSRILGKVPDVVTPNGFEPNFVPSGSDYVAKREEARSLLADVAGKLTGAPVGNNAFFIATAGRYEYRNKGLDVFIDAISSLRRRADIDREVVAFIMVPAWTHSARADLKYIIENNIEQDEPLQVPWITHWINNETDDRILGAIRSHGFEALGRVRIVYVPSYLNGCDGIFNRTYYELLIGMDATVFPSYYEPWGYTPLESIAFGTPTITTTLAGFGLWAQAEGAGLDASTGVKVIKRTDDNYDEVVKATADTIADLAAASEATTIEIRNRCRNLASQASWARFITYYYKAFGHALQKASQRTKN